MTTTPPEVIYLLDEIRSGVRAMDCEHEDSIDQIPALRKIVRASIEALGQLETRKDRWVVEALDSVEDDGNSLLARSYEYSQQVEERS